MQTKQNQIGDGLPSKEAPNDISNSIEEMIDNFTNYQKEMFTEFVEEICEKVTSVQESSWGDGLVFTTQHDNEDKEYEIQRNDSLCEIQAREYLEDGEMWRMVVESEHTTESLDDWIQTVLRFDGWEPSICIYDGCVEYTKSNFVYWRTN